MNQSGHRALTRSGRVSVQFCQIVASSICSCHFTDSGHSSSRKPLSHKRFNMAPEVGLEPTTHRLTADCSTIELLWNPKRTRNLQTAGRRVKSISPNYTCFFRPKQLLNFFIYVQRGLCLASPVEWLGLCGGVKQEEFVVNIVVIVNLSSSAKAFIGALPGGLPVHGWPRFHRELIFNGQNCSKPPH